MAEPVEESSSSANEEKPRGWQLLRSHFESSSKYSTALENFKGNLKSKYQANEEQIFKMGEHAGGQLAAHVRDLNNAILGVASIEFSGDSTHCTCNNECSRNLPKEACGCNCAKCYYLRPINNPESNRPVTPEHFKIIRHASLFQC